MKHLLFVLLCFAGLSGIGMAQIAKSVYIPGDAYTAYDIPEGGSALQLNINRADTNLVISDSEILLQDSSDTVQWYRSSASQATHVYQIGTVLSSREYLHVFGHWHYLGLAGSGPLPTFNVKVAAPNVDVDNMPEETEESVGVYLFKGGARKTVAVSAVKCRGPSNQQTLSWSSARLSLWTAATGGSMLSGNSATLSADAASTYYVQGDSASGSIRDSEISVSYTSSGNTTHDKVKLTVVKVEIKKPAGDPSLSAGAGGANQWNERVYNGASPGVATVVCESEDTPNADKLRWTIEDVGEIQATWEPHVDGNSHTGKGLNPTATFTGLPAQYTGFGSKTITLTMDEPGITTTDTQEVEIFFPRSAANHSFSDPNDPKQVGPNWYYYSLQILQCVADNWGYIDDAGISPAWKPMYDYTQGWIVLTPDRCPGNPFYYIAHENKHHTDFFQEIWQGTGYNEDEDEGDEDGIRDDFEIDHYGNLDKSFDYIMQEDWSEPRANAAGNAASGDASNWNKYWCDPGTLKGYQP